MPKSTTENWREQRLRWECDADVSLGDVARALNVSVPTVSIRAKRELWVKSEVIEPTRLTYTPKELVEVAVRALVRSCTQTKDPAAAVKAAGMLLDRTMGRVAAEQAAPMLTPADLAGPEEAEQWPEWLKAQRLAYAAGAVPSDEGAPALQEALEGPEPAETLPDDQIEPSSTTGSPARPALRSVPAPQPQFWAAPGRPAS